jgi:hypothetical protein
MTVDSYSVSSPAFQFQLIASCPVIRCSLSFSVSEEYLMGPSMLRLTSHFWSTLLQQCEPRSLLDHIVEIVTSDRIIATVTFDYIFA